MATERDALINEIIRDCCECPWPEEKDVDTVALRESDLRLILERNLAALAAPPVEQQATPAAEPVYIQSDHLQKARRSPHLCRVEPTQRLPDFVPLYTAPQPAEPAQPAPQAGAAKTDQFLQSQAEQHVRETTWFRTAPASIQHTLRVVVKGIEVLTGRSMMGGEVSGPCLIADATCGTETVRFCWAFRFGTTTDMGLSPLHRDCQT